MAKKKRTMTDLAESTPVMEVLSETGVHTVTEDFLPNDAAAEVEEVAAQQSEVKTNGGIQVIGDGGNGEHTPQPTEQVIFEIDPENILIDPDLKALRSWSSNAGHVLTLPQLARTMYEEGQQYPALMFQTDEGLVLYEGHRRREACVIIREEWDATFMLKAIVVPDMTKERALRMACLADSQHEKFGPLQVGRNIAFLRRHLDMVGGEHTTHIAEFLGVSPATVTEMERLAKAPKDVQAQVEAGRLTPSAALDLISMTSKVEEEERPAAQAAVVERAQELANQERQRKSGGKDAGRSPVTPEQAAIAKRTAESAKRDKEEKARLAAEAKAHPLDGAEQTSDPALLAEQPEHVAESAPEPEAAPETPAAPAPVTGKHVRQAARQVLDNPKLKAPKMSEAVELIEQWDGPAYPPVLMAFAGTFADWGRGKASDKTLEAAWDDIADALAGVVGTRVQLLKKVPVKKTATKSAPAKKAAPPAKKSAPAKKAPAKKTAAAVNKYKASPKKK